MLDLAGVAVAGAGTQLSKTIRDHAAAHFGGTGSSILCDGRQVSPVGAALAGYSAEDARLIAGRQSDAIAGILGYPGRAAMAHADDIVIWGE